MKIYFKLSPAQRTTLHNKMTTHNYHIIGGIHPSNPFHFPEIVQPKTVNHNVCPIMSCRRHNIVNCELRPGSCIQSAANKKNLCFKFTRHILHFFNINTITDYPHHSQAVMTLLSRSMRGRKA